MVSGSNPTQRSKHGMTSLLQSSFVAAQRNLQLTGRETEGEEMEGRNKNINGLFSVGAAFPNADL
jgi:hypothetical protein